MTRDEAKLLLADAVTSFNAMTIGAVLYEFVESDINLAECEKMLREIECETYLVAWNWTLMPPAIRPMNVHGNKCDCAVWICLHGERERDERLSDFGLTAEENLKHLARTGFSARVAHR